MTKLSTWVTLDGPRQAPRPSGEDISDAINSSTTATPPDLPPRLPTTSKQDSTMTAPASTRTPTVGPPTKHQLAMMIWVAVFPTLTALNLLLGEWLVDLNPVLRTFVLATVAVPIVVYGLMPQLHRLRVRLLSR